MATLVVVFDTNILFSGLSWHGSPYQCLQFARNGQIKSVTCREILIELEEKLRFKRGMTASQSSRAVAEILSFSTLVRISSSLSVVVIDPDDNKILECAELSGANFIVSGDHHLIDLGEFHNIPIIRASELIILVRESLDNEST